MQLKQIHGCVKVDEKVFKLQKKIYAALIRDLQKAVKKYNDKSYNVYGASLISSNDLIEWNKLGNKNRADYFYKQLPHFWGMNIGLTYCLSLVPVEDL